MQLSGQAFSYKQALLWYVYDQWWSLIWLLNLNLFQNGKKGKNRPKQKQKHIRKWGNIVFRCLSPLFAAINRIQSLIRILYDKVWM